MHNKKAFHKNSGNAVIIVLVVLAVVAVAALAFLSGKLTGKENAEQAAVSTPAAVQQAQTTANADVAQDGEQAELNIVPGNPVVAKVNGQDITRMDVFNFIQSLPPETRQMPIDQLFPAALEQVVSALVIQENTKNVRLDSDPEVKRQLDLAKENIVRNVYVQKQVEKAITDERLQALYAQYSENFPDIGEVKARHILVEDANKAKSLIRELDGGADFAELARANSTDGTAENGGEIGYFAEGDVVPEFSEAAFKLNTGEYSKSPVKTQFGYHIIQVEEKRKRPVASFEEAKPFLEAQLRQFALAEIVGEWRKKAKIELFDINGEAVPAVEAAQEESTGEESVAE